MNMDCRSMKILDLKYLIKVEAQGFMKKEN